MEQVVLVDENDNQIGIEEKMAAHSNGGKLHRAISVFIFNSKTAIPWLKKVRPNIHVKGGDRTLEEIPERKAIEAGGGRLVLIPIVPGISTTRTIKKIKKRSKKS